MCICLISLAKNRKVCELCSCHICISISTLPLLTWLLVFYTGCCISRESHTVIMGQRSTKGYPVPTIRPLPCLAKTCAHELGHALDLDHPRGKCFSDGTSYTHCYGRDNLMTGGQDNRGGGGSKLEEWQILVARNSAERFLQTLPNEVGTVL